MLGLDTDCLRYMEQIKAERLFGLLRFYANYAMYRTVFVLFVYRTNYYNML